MRWMISLLRHPCCDIHQRQVLEGFSWTGIWHGNRLIKHIKTVVKRDWRTIDNLALFWTWILQLFHPTNLDKLKSSLKSNFGMSLRYFLVMLVVLWTNYLSCMLLYLPGSGLCCHHWDLVAWWDSMVTNCWYLSVQRFQKGPKFYRWRRCYFELYFLLRYYLLWQCFLFHAIG